MGELITDTNFYVTFAVLAAAVLAAQVFNALRLRANEKAATPLKVKVIVESWWKILLYFFLAFLAGPWTLVPILYLTTLYALWEYARISGLSDHKTPLFAGSAMGISLHYLAIALANRTLFFVSIQIYALVIVIPLIVFTPRLHRLAELLAYYLGTMVFAVFLSFPAAIAVFEAPWIGSPSKARLAILLLIALTELNDVLQFIFGKLFGRRKVVPWISPNKTEAGFIGAFLVSTALGTFIWPHFLPVRPSFAALLAAALSIAGMLGDLVCSGIKRYRGVKDFSTLLPGHGGVLDRLDSLMVTAPVFFFFVYWMGGGT